jgi:AcrR family transcriptional regulator
LQGVSFRMTSARPHRAGRKPRADAQRNRERVLEAARGAFTRSGAHASLDDIARAAGVGPGTLYRHFPTREALLEAVYRTEIEKLAAAPLRLAGLPPIDALRAWLLLFVDALAAKKIIAPAMSAGGGGHAAAFEASYASMHDAVRALANRAVKSGDLRKDLDPVDLLRALVGASQVAPDRDWQSRARRLIDILIAGSRPGK